MKDQQKEQQKYDKILTKLRTLNDKLNRIEKQQKYIKSMLEQALNFPDCMFEERR